MTLPRGLLDYASQKSRREKGRGLSLLWRKLSRRSVPGLHVPAIPRPRRKCRRQHRESGLWFTACGLRANSTIPPSRSRNAPRALSYSRVFSPDHRALKAAFRERIVSLWIFWTIPESPTGSRPRKVPFVFWTGSISTVVFSLA